MTIIENPAVRRFRSMLNVSANSKGSTKLDLHDVNALRETYLASYAKNSGSEKFKILSEEICKFNVSDAYVRWCNACESFRPLEEFYVRAGGKSFIERCKTCCAEKAQKDKNFGRYFFALSLSSAKKRAAAKGIPFDLDTDYLNQIFPRDRKCPLLGVEMVPGVRGDNFSAPSLDKIIPSKGYVKGNVWYISMRANMIKMDHKLEDMLTTVIAIYSKLKDLDLVSEIDIDSAKKLDKLIHA